MIKFFLFECTETFIFIWLFYFEKYEKKKISKRTFRIKWGLLVAIGIRCDRLRIWVSYFIYFKFTAVFFQSMVFNSIKEIVRLRKEIYELLSIGMPNIYLNVTIEKNEKLMLSKLRFSRFKKFVTSSVFGELQLTKILLT